MRRVGKWALGTAMFIVVVMGASTAIANDDNDDDDGQEGVFSTTEREGRQTVLRGPPEPVPVFSGRTVAYQLAAGTSMMVGVGALGTGLLAAGYAAGDSETAQAFAWPGAFALIFAPPLGAIIGTTWMGHRRYERGTENLSWTSQGSALGWLAGTSVFALTLDDYEHGDFDGRDAAIYFATSAVGSLAGAIVGYHLSQWRENHRAATDIRRWSRIDVTPLGIDDGAAGSGLMIRTSGRF